MEDSVKKCCVALMLLTATNAVAAQPDSARFIDFTGTTIDGHTARPAAMYLESHQRARFDRLLTLKKSLRPELTATIQEPALR